MDPNSFLSPPPPIIPSDTFAKLNQAWTTHPLPQTTPRNIGLDVPPAGPSHFSASSIFVDLAMDAHNTLDRSVVVAVTRLEDVDSVTERPPPQTYGDLHIVSPPTTKDPHMLNAIGEGTMVELCDGAFLSARRARRRGLIACPGHHSRSPSVSTTTSGATSSSWSRPSTSHARTIIPTPEFLESEQKTKSAKKREKKKIRDAVKAGKEEVDEDPILWDGYYAPSLPFKTVLPIVQDPRFYSEPGKTAYFATLESKLTDPTGSGALLNLVRGFPNKDITSIYSVIKSLLTAADCWREEAAIVRAVLLANTLSKEGMRVDPTPLKFIRRTTNAPRTATPHFFFPSPEPAKNAWAFSVTSIDTLGQYLLNKWGPNATFPSSGLDKQWTIIPVTHKDWTPSSIVPYLASFLDTSLWTGKVNYYVTTSPAGTSTDPAQFKHRVRYTLMPASAMALIPGPKKFILCFMDTTSQYMPSTVQIDKSNYKVCTQPDHLLDSQFLYDWYAQVWKPWFVATRANDLATHCGFAYNRLVSEYSVGDTVGRALTIASELSTLLSYGLAVRDDPKSATPVSGAWAWGGGYVDNAETALTAADCWGTRTTDQINQWVLGKAYSQITPWHFLPSSYCKTAHTVTYENKTIAGKAVRIAKENLVSLPLSQSDTYSPYIHPNPQYNTFTASSVYRIAIRMGLISTHSTQDYTVLHSAALQMFTHGISCAMALNTASFLATSRIPLNTWQGRSSDMDTGHQLWMRTKISEYTLYCANFSFIEEIYEDDQEWGWDKVIDYYPSTSWDSFKWSQCSPVSSHFVFQWWQKVGETFPSSITPTLSVLTPTVRIVGLETFAASPKEIAIAATTPSILDTRPLILGEDGMEQTLWYEDFQGTSLIAPAYNGFLNKTRFSSTLCTVPAYDWPNKTLPVHCFITNSPAFNVMTNQTALSGSPIIYPDPPSLGGFLEKARDYVLFPAVTAGLGYLAGGVPGAVVGATKAVIDAIKTDSARAKLSAATDKISQQLQKLPAPSTTPPIPQVEIPKTGTPVATDSSDHSQPSPDM